MKPARLGAIVALAAASAFTTHFAWAEGGTEVGMEKANTCMGCHGIPGYNNAYPSFRVPKLGGQSSKYIEAALKAYRSGERPHATMHAQAADMSDQDIADVASYLATAPHK